MTDIPERIWVWRYKDAMTPNGEWYTEEVGLDGDEAEYIRADIAEAEIERLRDEVKQARAKALRDALRIAEEMERQNGPLSKKGFNEKYRLGLQSAGNAIANAIRALIDKEAGE